MNEIKSYNYDDFVIVLMISIPFHLRIMPTMSYYYNAISTLLRVRQLLYLIEIGWIALREYNHSLNTIKLTMGKKDLNRKRKREDHDDGEDSENLLEADPELQAELAAVMSIRAEKEGNQGDSGANTVYNRDALLKCIQDLETIDLPFVQTMEISEFEFPQTNELDDMEREMNFYNHTVMAVKAGQDQLFALGVPVYRPHDFFCEHVKSDAHMAKVRQPCTLNMTLINTFPFVLFIRID